jgi:hypothetical protein
MTLIRASGAVLRGLRCISMSNMIIYAGVQSLIFGDTSVSCCQQFTASSSAPVDQALDILEKALTFIFSWLAILAIGIIASGKLLAQTFKLPGRLVQATDFFSVPIPKVLRFQAQNDEVILGFTGFIITLFSVGSIGGGNAYTFFKSHFGIDPGQFNSLCVFSGFITVMWSFLLYLLTSRKQTPRDPLLKEHGHLIEEIRRREGENDQL